MTPQTKRLAIGGATTGVAAVILLLLFFHPGITQSTTTTTLTTSVVTTTTVYSTTTSLTAAPTISKTTTVTSTTTSNFTTTTTVTISPTAYLTVNSSSSHFVDIWANGVQTSSGLTNTSLAVMRGENFTLGAFDNGCYRFSHWTGGSVQRFRVMSIESNTTITAFYSDICVPLPTGYSNISVTTIDGSGAVNGVYVTLWQNGALNASCFSPCSFAISSGTYAVAVSNYGGLIFNHWTDGSTSSSHTVIANDSKINMTAVYNVPIGLAFEGVGP